MSRHFPWRAALALLSLSLNIFFLYTFIVAGKTEKSNSAADSRTALVLNAEERALVLAEMRSFLSAIQTMNSALAANDMAQVEKSARSVGRAAAHEVPTTLMAKLPLPFKQLGLSTHEGFDEIALDAHDLADANHSLQQLGTLMNNCVACHASFQLQAAPARAQ